MSRKSISRRVFVKAAAVAAVAPYVTRTNAAGPIRVISHRQPALEYYTDQMKKALPEGQVSVELMPIDKEVELASITMSARSDAIDVAYLNDTTMQKFAASGWLEPLDELWAKYKDEFKLDDFPKSVMESMTHKGHIYSMPILTNTEMFFYREDLFKENRLAPPKTMQEYLDAAKKLHQGRVSGTVMTLKPVDGCLNESHWYLNAVGEGWFDKDWKPIFNQPAGVNAITLMKQMTAFAPRGFTSAANDESTINLQQGLAAMGLQWFTRAASMDDEKKSRFVGKINWVAPPGGGQRIANDGFAISKYSSKDKDAIFKMIATAASQKSMQKGAELAMPPRLSVLGDAELASRYRWYPGARASLEVGKPFPPLPEFLDVGAIVTRHILQAVTNEKEVKVALDQAAQETTELLKSRGYYK
ncbi:extracellular solute-binding protein [Bradyrhizobium sp.]|uniref:extracellular solute-binding protein n=1 Tax=Bradyrhizobium sp. TaxID=376 RepID=UPI002B90B1CF|nr:extracellular solute-binding protein [Bradyrhizobium sp.]HMM88928.1 extracellular solute-binding protein [Bradyrhizobium sp.]